MRRIRAFAALVFMIDHRWREDEKGILQVTSKVLESIVFEYLQQLLIGALAVRAV